ncbi:MAG: DUF1499 domain-containing protein [Spartobacteria bacterium]
MIVPCPSSPNCVSTEAQDKTHAVEPFLVLASRDDLWAQVREILLSLPRTSLAEENPNYLHAECRSAKLGFIDDLELQLRSEQGKVVVRSAARSGYYDFGVNRRRVEQLRQLLQVRGLIR